MPSMRRHEGYVILDNRASGGTLEERPIYTCSHCQRGVVVQPLRTRARSYCPKCDHVICDQCEQIRVAAGGECVPFKQILDEQQERAAREEQARERGIIFTS